MVTFGHFWSNMKKLKRKQTMVQSKKKVCKSQFQKNKNKNKREGLKKSFK